MKPNVSCNNEALRCPYGIIQLGPITDKDKMLDSKVLKPCGMLVLKHVIRDGLFLTPQELAVKCNIKVINAGKIMAGLKNT